MLAGRKRTIANCIGRGKDIDTTGFRPLSRENSLSSTRKRDSALSVWHLSIGVNQGQPAKAKASKSALNGAKPRRKWALEGPSVFPIEIAALWKTARLDVSHPEV